MGAGVLVMAPLDARALTELLREALTCVKKSRKPNCNKENFFGP